MSDELPMYGDLMVQYEECQSQVAHLRQENAQLKADLQVQINTANINFQLA